ncbi:unnamed protein product [Mytilus coruscus]|uniref:ZMYM2-like/QRICH1 C-terminal domain-containing protein n=1 Tax=Mytilus coruscus TaxID=42192 RepID=A0A6J7ZZY5_MYTCO|nr:unnamed protein product [Mytilus coruscus]
MKERAIEGLVANTRKQADVISVDEETALFDKGILGVDNPQQLLDTLLYLCGLHFALRGGNEHRRLRLNSNPQITGPFQDKDAKLRYLLYKEDVSKAKAGGLKHRKVAPKCVRAFENPENRNKCHRSKAVRVYKRTSADQQIEASNILYGLRPSDGSKKAKPSELPVHQLVVLRLNVQQTRKPTEMLPRRRKKTGCKDELTPKPMIKLSYYKGNVDAQQLAQHISTFHSYIDILYNVKQTKFRAVPTETVDIALN